MDNEQQIRCGLLLLLNEDQCEYRGTKRLQPVDTDTEEEEEEEDEEALPKRRRVHECWVQKILLRRDEKNHNTQYDLMMELIVENNLKELQKLIRMDNACFEAILEAIYPQIVKKDTHWRKAIKAAYRLCVALRFLATGESFVELHFAFRIGEKTARTIVYEVANAIYDRMGTQYLKCPDTEQEWMDVAEGFRSRWEFPNCIGALDGKHIPIQPPPGTGSLYHNYKGGFSIILMALVNANYEFMYVDCGAEGRAGDAGVWNKCSLKKFLDAKRLAQPIQSTLPNTTKKAPYVIVADDAFAMTEHLLKPHTCAQKTLRHHVFDYRLSRARRVSENVFGILVNRFRCLKNPLNMIKKNAVDITMACCVLHNYLRQAIGESYLRPVSDSDVWDNESTLSCLKGMNKTSAKNPTERSKTTREIYTNYFMTREGAIPMQWHKVQVKMNLTEN